MPIDYEQVLNDAEGVLGRVDAALARLADGSYGSCVTCGEPITEDRLAETPTADGCAKHAA